MRAYEPFHLKYATDPALTLTGCRIMIYWMVKYLFCLMPTGAQMSPSGNLPEPRPRPRFPHGLGYCCWLLWHGAPFILRSCGAHPKEWPVLQLIACIPVKNLLQLPKLPLREILEASCIVQAAPVVIRLTERELPVPSLLWPARRPSRMKILRDTLKLSYSACRARPSMV